MRIAVLSLALVASLTLFAACSKQSPPGGPGAAQGPAEPAATPSGGAAAPSEVPAATADTENTFTLKVPVTASHVKRGAKEEVTVGISRGSKFEQAVSLKAEAPTGLTVNPAESKLEPGQTEVKLTVEAAADAPLGDQQIRLIGTPQTGKAVEIMLPIRVDEK